MINLTISISYIVLTFTISIVCFGAILFCTFYVCKMFDRWNDAGEVMILSFFRTVSVNQFFIALITLYTYFYGVDVVGYDKHLLLGISFIAGCILVINEICIKVFNLPKLIGIYKGMLRYYP